MKLKLKYLIIVLMACFCFFPCISVNAGEINYGYAEVKNGSSSYPEDMAKANVASTVMEQAKKLVTAGWSTMNVSIDVSSAKIPASEAWSVYLELVYENPEYFYIMTSASWMSDGSYVLSYTPTYLIDKSQLSAYKNKFNAVINSIKSDMPSELSDLEKALYINEYMNTHCEYVYDGNLCYTAYGSLVNGQAVCQGYSMGYEVIAHLLGLECHIVTSDNLNHGWNLVKVNGTYYYVDTTWNDPLWDELGRACHSNFLLSFSGLYNSGHNSTDWEIFGVNINLTEVADNRYDKAVWSNINTAFYYDNGFWYGTDEYSHLAQYTCDGINFTKKSVLDSNGYCSSDAYYLGVLYYVKGNSMYYYDIATADKGILSGVGSANYVFIDQNGNASYSYNGIVYDFTSCLISEKMDISRFEMNFVISGRVLTNDKTVAYTYSGTEKKPTVSIIVNGRTLVNGTDYTLSYANNINVGTASVTATGKGRYTGKLTRKFMISANYSCGNNAKWSFDKETGKLSITGSGDMFDWESVSKTPWASVADSIKTVDIADGITSIGKNAFNSCATLVTVTGCKGIKEIKACAFRNCFALTKVTGCANLKKVGEMGFHNAQKLSRIGNTEGNFELGNIEVIGTNAFFACKSVKGVKTGANLTAIGSNGFRTCVSLKTIIVGSKCNRFGNYAFANDANLIKIVGATNVQTIETYTFSGCTKLETLGNYEGKINLPAIKVIGAYAFSSCKGLTSVTTGDYLEKISYNVFNCCSNLKKIYIRTKKLTAVGTDAFKSIGDKATIYITASKYDAYKKMITDKRVKAGTIFAKY